MNNNIKSILKVREYVLEQIKDLNATQLNETPNGFNNNIIWNLGHMISAQQGICYKRANVKMVVDESFFELFKPGTKPESFIQEKEIEDIHEKMVSTIEALSIDYEKKVFNQYSGWSTRYGVELSGIDEALQFLLYHEGLHSGVILSIKKLIKKK